VVAQDDDLAAWVAEHFKGLALGDQILVSVTHSGFGLARVGDLTIGQLR